MSHVSLRRIICGILSMIPRYIVSANPVTPPGSSSCTDISSQLATQAPDRSVAIAELLDHADLLRRDCPVPCGWENQYCCNANEICYTGYDSKATCAATTSPFDNTQTVTVPMIVQTSLIRSTMTVTSTKFNISQDGYSKPPPSTVILTYVKTSTVVYSAPPSRPTSHSSQGAHFQQTPSKKDHSWPTWKKVVIPIAAVAGIVLIAALVWFIIKNRNSRQRRGSDAPDSEHPQDTAIIQEKRSAGSTRTDHYAPFLQPRPSVIMRGQNPYEPSRRQNEPPFDPEDYAAPPYPGRVASPRYSSVNGSHSVDSVAGYGRRQQVPRRPVRGMQSSVEDGVEY